MIRNLWLLDKGANGHFSNTQSTLLQSNGYALHGKNGKLREISPDGAVNAYLRWINSMTNILEVLENIP